MSLTIGEYVTRISYEHDLLFRVATISGDMAILHGDDIRLAADAPLNDLVRVDEAELAERKKQVKELEEFSYYLFRQDYKLMKEKRDYQSGQGYAHEAGLFRMPVPILHIDGDETYLQKCTRLYKRLGLNIHGVHIHESEMPDKIGELMNEIKPQIIVITGHDAYSQSDGEKSELKAYRNSGYFAETVRIIREIYPKLDDLVIFAGACQSHFESLIQAGANYASAPARINIHALDPVYIAAKIAYTPFKETMNVWEALRHTLSGEYGIGGLETKGLMRTGMPNISTEDADNK